LPTICSARAVASLVASASMLTYRSK
jgi:hypothetical protein